VHRAITRDGTRVAVKVQYPGICQAIDNDFKLFHAASKPAQASGHIPKAVIDEIQKQIVAETDYGREADNIEFFERGLAPLRFVTVPHVHREYSSDRVLTMSLLPGRHLGEFLARRPSQKLRDQLGAHLFELYHFQVLKLEALHADPHWGNYLFDDDANIGLVDFGCVKYLAPTSVAYLRSIYLYPGATDSPEFYRLVEKHHAPARGTLSRAARQAVKDFADNFYRKVYPPEAKHQQQPFDFGDPAFLRDYLRGSQDLARTKGVMTEFIFMGRAEMGLYQTLHRLRARVLTSQIVRKCLQAR
jgi:predicted unusual protein kinase regulating ubiquinone biosynthesis (AarF/ABC1/UbiB family)